jgi:two-component system, response regulator PdtaR
MPQVPRWVPRVSSMPGDITSMPGDITRCPGWDSNPHCMVFETMDSASWSTGARPAARRGSRPNVNLPAAGTLVPVSQTPFRVVIAEDEALIRLDLKEMLEEEGYIVAGEAADGEAAVDLATKLRPDLVILDVKMPILDGITAAERIAAEHIAPVVILTAFSQRELVERARDAGAMAYLVKPFTKADLVPAIEIAASRFQETSALETEVATLKDRLEVRKILDRAKGKLQAEYGLSEPEAFRWIQKTSMDQRLAMRTVAERLLDGAMAPASAEAPPPAAGQPAKPVPEAKAAPES